MAKPAILRQAPDTDSAAAGTADSADSKRKQVSKRLFIDGQGNEVDKIEECSGARYVLLSPNGNKAIDYVFGANPAADKMFAAFGFHTKAGNVANTVLNDKDEPGTPDDAAAEIDSWLKGVGNGIWAERGAGGVGARIDKDALAGAIIAVAVREGKKRKDGTPVSDADYAAIRDRLENEPQYVRAVRQVPEVQTEYATRVGRPTKSLDDLL